MTQKAPQIGDLIDGRYRIVSHIATGSMGVVYRAERVGLGRTVAIKFVCAPASRAEEFIKRFEVEARALSRLSHPNCVSIIDYGVAPQPYFVMEFVRGLTLLDIIERGPMPPVRAIGIARQLLAALSHAHGHGVIHRDIKPANVALTEDVTGTGDFVRVLDFGLVQFRDKAVEADRYTALGTPSYMPPEQVRAQVVDARSDVYAAGVLLFELLTGRKPFSCPEPLETLRMQLEQTPPRLRDVSPTVSVSSKLETVVRKCMAKDPDQRFQSAADLATALLATPEGKRASRQAATIGFALSRGPEGDASLPRPARLASKRRRRRWGLRLLGLAIIGSATAVAYGIHLRIKNDSENRTPISRVRSHSR